MRMGEARGAAAGSSTSHTGTPDLVLASSEDMLRLALRDATARENRRRARVLGPLLALVHFFHFIVFHFTTVGGTSIVATSWRGQLALAQGVAMVGCIGLAAIGYAKSDQVAGRLMPVVGVLYLVFGAWVASIDQLVTTAITPYILVCVGVAAVIHWPMRIAVPAFVAGFALMLTLGWRAQGDAALRTSMAMNALSAAALGLGLSLFGRRAIIARVKQSAVIDAQKKALERLANQDALTELPNRRVFSRALQIAVSAANDGTTTTVALFDLDNFKRVNDEHGHGVGDQVLRSTAWVLQDALRTDDLAARLGGEEFGVLLSGVDGPKAQQVLEDIRRALAEQSVGPDNLRVTTSVGHTAVRADDGEDGQKALRRADTALYEAKSRGRNQVVEA